MAKLTKDIFAVRPGEIYPSRLKAGEDVEGRLAEIAEQMGALRQSKAPEKHKAHKSAPENK